MVTRRPIPVARSDEEMIMDAYPARGHPIHRQSDDPGPGSLHIEHGPSRHTFGATTPPRP